jgi:uncharacterized membrane protein
MSSVTTGATGPQTAEHGDEPDAGRPEQPMSAERLVFFSDAVVAIAMTLLALELPVPDGGSNEEVLRHLRDNSGEFIAFLISFAVIGVQWIGHHRLFAHVAGLGGGVMRWNLMWLLTIVVTPFATKVLTGDGAFEVRFAVYAAVQAMSGLFFFCMLYDIGRLGLLSRDAPAEVLSRSRMRLAVMALAFAVSIPVAFHTHWAYQCWVAIPVVTRLVLVFSRRRSSRRARAVA